MPADRPAPGAPRLAALHLSFAADPTVEPFGVSLRQLDDLMAGADGSPVERVSIGDHQGSHLECYTGLGYLAARSRRVRLGPTVTNTVNREAAVHAASLATLDAASGGRAFAVFGRGDGAVRNLGRRPQPVDEFASSFGVLRELLERGESRDRDRRVTMRWPVDLGSRIPLGIAAGGPRMARLAGRLADDVYLSTGLDAQSIETALDEVAAGAAEAGRGAPRAWWVVPFGIAEDRAAALRRVGPTLSTLANHSLRGGGYEARGVPEQHRDALAEFHRRFDWTKKNVAGAEHANADLMAEVGILDYLLDRYALAGTPDDAVERLAELVDRGVERVMIKVNSRAELDLVVSQLLPRLEIGEA